MCVQRHKCDKTVKNCVFNMMLSMCVNKRQTTVCVSVSVMCLSQLPAITIHASNRWLEQQCVGGTPDMPRHDGGGGNGVERKERSE